MRATLYTSALALISVSACASLPDPIQFHTMPTFATDRVERIGEPITVVMVGARKLEQMQLSDGRSVQAMPVLLEIKHVAGMPELRWAELARRVTVPLVDDPQSSSRARVYVLGSTTISASAQGAGRIQANPAQKLTDVRIEQQDPEESLARQERQFLQQLDEGEYHSADVLLVCVPPKGDPSAKCFLPGGRYQLTIDPERRPSAEFPFRMERRNGTLGAITGLSLIAIFVFLNTH